MTWYGLYEEGELIAVKRFFNPPSILDFNMYYYGDSNYEIVRVTIAPEG